MLRRASALATIASVVLLIAAFTLFSDRVGLAQENSGASRSVGPVSVSSTTRPATGKKAAGATSQPSVSFRPAMIWVAGALPGFVGSLAVSDVNGDGKLDLVVVNVGQNQGEAVSVGVLLGKGDGTFQPPILNSSLSQVGEFNALAVADVNADGKPDLIVDTCCASNGDDEAAVLLGKGDGTFQAPVRYDLGGSFSVIAASDVNGDGKPDIISANYNGGTVTALLGNGDGTFQSPISTPGPSDASCLVVADVNGDGKPDALVCSQFSVAVLLGNGDGTFQSFTNTTINTGCTSSPVIADLNGDGTVDMVAPNAGADDCTNNGSAGVLLGTGTDALFQPEVDYAATTTNTVGVGGAVVADVNGDGKPDIIVAGGFAFIGFTSSVAVLLGNGNGEFQPAVPFSTASTGAIVIAAADFNGDGKPDIVTAGDVVQAVSVLINNTVSTGAPTATAIASSLNPSVFGQSVTLGATVTSSGGTPTGTVGFYNGTTSIGSGSLESGEASILIPSLPAGSDSVAAAYQGSSAFATSASAPLIQVVSAANTSTTLASSPNPAGTGQSIAFTATVTSQYGGATAGSVTFFSGSQTLGTASMSGNVATFNTSFAAGGTYSITAHYNGDSNNSATTSAALSEKIIASTSTALVSSLNPSLAGQSITFTATVTSNSGTPPNGETITFYNGSTALGGGVLSGGTASLTTSSLSAGTHSITASYAGDSNFFSSTSAALRQVVNPKSATATTIASSLNPSIYGQKVTWSATVTTSGPVPPTGKVNFVWSGYNIGTATLNSSGVATFTRSNLNVGTVPLTAIYVGDANNLGSTSSVVNQVITQATSAATLTSSPNPSSSGEAVTFTATITSPTFISTGPVIFTAGKTALGTANLSGGKAKFTTSTLAVGKTTVKATYAGSSDVAESSATVKQTVQ